MRSMTLFLSTVCAAIIASILLVSPTRANSPAAAPTPTPKTGVVKNSDEDITTRALNYVVPERSAAARRAGAFGDVKIRISVGRNGHVTAARTISGDRLLTPTALAAARKLMFPTGSQATGGIVSYYFIPAVTPHVYSIKLGSTDVDKPAIKPPEREDNDDSVPQPPPAPHKPPKVISGGALNGKATHLGQLKVPPAAKAVKASGTVTVQVLIDEEGHVVSASAVSGHPLLQGAAVKAARESTFSPTLLSGIPVKVSGVLVFIVSP